MPCLGLDRLNCHAGFAKAGEAGVTQLVAGQPLQTCSGSSTGDDLIEPSGAEWLTSASALEHHKHAVGCRRARTLGLQISRQRGEKPGRDRDDPLMASLALGDNQPALANP